MWQAKRPKKGFSMNKRSLFSVDIPGKTIYASAATLSRATNPNSKEYIELCLLLADHPGFKVKEKASNKTTYDGLTFKFMRDYISIQTDCDELMDEFEAVKLSSGEKYPIVKKWFLDTFKNEDGKFNMNKAKREITNGKIEAAKVRVKQVRKDGNISFATPKIVNQ